MTEAPYVRQRVNVAQTAKGLHQVEATVEILSPAGENPTVVADNVLRLIEETENKLRLSHRKLVVDTE